MREDDCHLLWGEVCGRVWGNRHAPLVVPMTNERQRQTYDGALNLLTHDFPLQEGAAGDGKPTVAYLAWGQSLYPGKQLLFLWEGASSPRGAELQEFLGRETAGLREEDGKVTCVLFAPHAPEQHPPEDVWLKGTTHLRKQFAVNKTLAQVKRCFSAFLSAFSFDSAKLRWYWPKEQMI